MMTRIAALLIGSVLVSPNASVTRRLRKSSARTATHHGDIAHVQERVGRVGNDSASARHELNAQLMENERLRDGRPKTELTSPQAVCQRPAPPPALPAMPELEQLEAGSAQLQTHTTDIQSYLACLNGRIHATADPIARAVTRGQYYQAERHAIDRPIHRP